MNPPDATSLMMLVIERAMAGSGSLPPAERADLYQGLAMLLSPDQSLERLTLAESAARTAEALREAEGKQLTFAALLRQSATA